MDDRMKESISALLDNEADELELRRVLNHSDNAEMKAVWARYSKVSDLMSSRQGSYSRQGSDQRCLYERDSEDSLASSHNGFLDIDISIQVSRSVDQIEGREVDLGQEGVGTTIVSPLEGNKKRFRVTSMVAVAATIMMAISLVFKPLDNVDVSTEVLVAYNDMDNVSHAMVDGAEGALSERQSMAGYVANVSSADSIPMVKKPFSPEHASKLNQYLLRHAENSVAGGRSGLMPLARVVSFTIAKN